MGMFSEPIQVGRSVRVRDFSELERKYGLTCYGNIDTNPVFTKEQEQYCGFCFQVDHVYDNEVYLSDTSGLFDEEICDYGFPKESLVVL